MPYTICHMPLRLANLPYFLYPFNTLYSNILAFKGVCMAEILEIRWHGRGGQGAVTAAKLVAETALEQGKFFQGFPEYGAERMGAPIQAFTRISSEPIHLHCNVTNPQIVVVLDPTLLSVVNVADGLAQDGVLIINTGDEPGEIRKQLGLSAHRIFTVDASRIAQESIGKNIPNTPMLGALIRATGLMEIEQAVAYLKKSFGKKFSEEVIQGNVQALQRAYQEVKGE